MRAKLTLLVLAFGLFTMTATPAAAGSGDSGDGAGDAAPCQIREHYKETKLGTLRYPHPHCDLPSLTCDLHQHDLETSVGTVQYPHLHVESCQASGLP